MQGDDPRRICARNQNNDRQGDTGISISGLLLATIALAIFVLEKSNRGLRGLNGSEGICVSSAVSALSAVQQFFKFL
jgi:hypothetical protein